VKVSWRWKARTEHGATIILEFLAYDPEKAGGRVTELETAGNVTAMNIPHADIVFDLNDREAVTAELLDGGGVVTETIAHADRVSFICLKAFAFDDRGERKDAHDIVYCLEHGIGGVDGAVAEFLAAAKGKHRDVIVKALRRLQSRFGDDERTEAYLKDGPVKAARFEIGDEPDLAEERALRQRVVSDMTCRLLQPLAHLWQEAPVPADTPGG